MKNQRSGRSVKMRMIEKIEVVNNLQETSAEVFKTVTSYLKVGMSEFAIAEAVRLEFQKNGITPLWDARKNVGHSLHAGAKDKANRVWLDSNNTNPLGEGFFGVEPCGYRKERDGKGVVVARFEESIYIPNNGNAVILGSKELVPLSIE